MSSAARALAFVIQISVEWNNAYMLDRISRGEVMAYKRVGEQNTQSAWRRRAYNSSAAWTALDPAAILER